jgi:hypothetical protein
VIIASSVRRPIFRGRRSGFVNIPNLTAPGAPAEDRGMDDEIDAREAARNRRRDRDADA